MKTLRNLLALAIAVIAASCSTKVEPTASIFRLEGVEPAVHYSAPTPLSDGFDGEIAVIMAHGWHGGVQVLQSQLCSLFAIGTSKTTDDHSKYSNTLKA